MVYGWVPPDGNTLTTPAHGQSQLVTVPVVVAVRGGGSAMVAIDVLMQSLASVIVPVYVPAHKPAAVAVFCGGVVFQE